MDFLETPTRRKILFGLLYLSEGAPIGFIWLGLPTRLRAAEVPVEQITWLMAILIMPWTLKFLWAPLVDLLRSPQWGFKNWILVSQSAMAMTLLPLMWLDVADQFPVAAIWLILHAVCAATQDISIDALCVQESKPLERAALNGWMQCGVLVGRAAMGGGSLILEYWIGFPAVVGVLIAIVMSSAILLWFTKESPIALPSLTSARTSKRNSMFKTLISRLTTMGCEIIRSLRSRKIWIGFLFALSAPAAFKSMEAIVGPFLIDRGYSEFQIGKFTATVMIGGMIVGSLLAGRFAARSQGVGFVATALFLNVGTIALLASGDFFLGGRAGLHLFIFLALVSVSIGWFTVALYQWLMNLTSPQLAATQFTAFMAATNACEAWSTALLGSLESKFGYPLAILGLCGLSIIAATLLIRYDSYDSGENVSFVNETRTVFETHS